MLPSHLGLGDKDIIDTLNTVRTGGDYEWVVYHVDARNGDLVKDDTGNSVGDMVYLMDGSQVQFAYLRYEMDQTKKFLSVCWCGQGSQDKLKTKFVYYSRDWEDFLKKNQHSISVNISARKEEDVEEAVIVDKLNKSTGTFVRARKTGEQKEDLQGKAKGFWTQQKTVDEKYKTEMDQKAKEREADLASSRAAQAQKLKNQAEEEMRQKNAQREQEVNAFRSQQQQRDQAEQQRWKQQVEADKSKSAARREQEVNAYNQQQQQRDQAEQQRWKGIEQQHRQDVQSHYQESEQQQAAPQVKGNVSAFKNKFAQYAEESEQVPQKPVSSGRKWQPPAKAAEPAAPVQQYEEPQQEVQQEEVPVEQEQYQEEPQQQEEYQEQPPQQQYEEPQQEQAPVEQEQYQEEAQQEPAQGDVYVAEFDYEGQQEGDLSFKEGEQLTLISTEDPEWPIARNAQGVEGSVPMNYLAKH
ncbi:hypothetical protein EIN_044390 [Entamoeba invadens IP1]|uniref:Uncharacterized protein n=2 Tax=Entamoeba invadens TaxID=33085 RepID=A0A0A1U561_ENTIV|nr:hypothetical protein EIN_044390 [Entamoeba invadens IP1]ELP86881.1 hypothetical protein EIN_044390 [Entamoeba invadens IP1]BAN42305.1 hypothetical protein, conserved [Entamoeba invadens]|eukprot:XP_004253652.1 hypothetical protein EIN_044390 [Entamoeba invadens IP1]